MISDRSSINLDSQLSNQLLNLTRLTEKLTIKILELEEKFADLEEERISRDPSSPHQTSTDKNQNLFQEQYFEVGFDNENKVLSESIPPMGESDQTVEEALETEYIDEPHMPFMD